MVKQKTLKSSFQKTGSSRRMKNLADARLLLVTSKPKRGHGEYVCSVCEDKGTLLACVKCFKLFHLVCLGVTVHNLPLSEWACSSCLNDYQAYHLSLLNTFIDSQRQDKELLVKKIGHKLGKIEKNTKLRDFEEKYPHLVKNRQILYPIDDSLLWVKPKLHQIQASNCPSPHYFNYPIEIQDDLIYLCDFSLTFHDILNTPILKSEILYASLSSPQETPISKHLHISFLKPLAQLLIKSESYRKKGKVLNYLIYKCKKTITLDKLLEYSYLTFIECLFQTEIFEGVMEDYEELVNFFEDFSFVNDYYLLDVTYKLNLLVFISSLLLDSKMFNEECTRRVEEQSVLYKEYNEIGSMLKNKKYTNDISELETRCDQIKSKLKQSIIRTVRLGVDRDFNEYYFFQWDTSKLYIKRSDSKDKDSLRWAYYEKKPEIENLISYLCPKGTRESELQENLLKLISNNEITSAEVESTSSETDEDKKNTHNTYNINTLKEWLKTLHVSVADTFRIPACVSYLNSVDSGDFNDIVLLILNFNQSFDERRCLEEPCKVVNRSIGVWDLCDLHPIWETSLKECQNVSELFICMHLLSDKVEKFNETNKVIEATESKYSIARRSYRLERLNKLKKEIVKDQDLNCYLCGELGLVACCDNCPKVAHLECLNTNTLPEGIWHCPVCVEKSSTVRVTRSKQIKY
jgi:Williams-Beuren syndrome DDT (WSD), D-TOX E motif